MSWDVEDKAAEASKGADAARCRVPVRPHTHADPAPLAVAESADGAGGGGARNVVRAAKDAGGVRRVVVTLSISALVPSPGWPSGEVLDERCWTDIDYCEKNRVSLAYLPTPAAWVLPSQ